MTDHWPGPARRTLLTALPGALLGAAADAAPPLILDAPNGPGTLRVLNPGQAAVTVAGAVDVQVLYDGRWQPTGTYFFMVERCGGRDPATATVQPGVPFTVVPWTGWSCSGQCPRPCRANVPLGGTLRPVLTVLPSGLRVIGPVWEMQGASGRGARPP